MNPSNYGYENLTPTQVKKELIKVTREYNRLKRLEKRAKREPMKQVQIETTATSLYVRRKTLELMLKTMENK